MICFDFFFFSCDFSDNTWLQINFFIFFNLITDNHQSPTHPVFKLILSREAPNLRKNYYKLGKNLRKIKGVQRNIILFAF